MYKCIIQIPQVCTGQIWKKELKANSTNHKEKYNKIKKIETDISMTNWTFRGHMRLSPEP